MVFIIQQILPQYRHDLLRHLPADKFFVFYSDDVKDRSLGSVQTSEPVFHKVPIRKIKGFYFQPILSYIRKHKPSVVVLPPELKNLNYWWMFVLKFFYHYKLVAWTHGVNNRDFYAGLSMQSKTRLFMMRLADKILVYSHERAAALKQHLKKDMLVASNTLDTNQLNSVYDRLEHLPVGELKKKYEVTTGKVLIYVGRLIKSKEVEKSIDLFHTVLQQVPDLTLLIVGDGPERANLEQYAASLGLGTQVKFLGKITDSAITGELLFLSDMQLHLGYVGLAVVDSMCFGTPVVTLAPTAAGPFHSPEFCYLHNGRNAVIAADVASAAADVASWLKDEAGLRNLQAQARTTFLQDCSMDNFLNAVNVLNEQ